MQSFVRLFLFGLLLHCNILQAQKTTNEAIPLNPIIKTGVLPNGLKYFILQNKKPENKIELRLAVNAGSILEGDDQQGLAHFIEHMNFNGLTHFPHNDLVHYLQSVGVKFGADLNAYTSFEETVYMLPIPSTDKAVVDKGFTVIADWSQGALLDKSEIEKERGVVLEESRLGKGADDRMMKKYFPDMFTGSVYAKRLPIGKDSILKNFKYNVLNRFYKDWYRPDNEAVIVVGDIDVAEAERLIKEKFSGFKNPSPEKPRGGNILLSSRKVNKAMVVTDKEANYTAVMIFGDNKKSVAKNTNADYRNGLVKTIFNNMFGERLNELKNSPTPPFVFGSAGIGDGMARGWEAFNGFAVCSAAQVKEATEALIKESMRVKKYGFTAAELERVKAALIAQYETNYNERDKTESSNLVEELVRHFLSHEAVPGIEWEYSFSKKAIPSIGLTEVNELAKQIDINTKFFALVTSPEDPSLPSNNTFLNWVKNDLQLPVKPYEEKKVGTSLLATPPIPGNIVKEESNAKLGTTTYTLSNGASVTIKPTDFKNDEVVLTSNRLGGSSLYEGTDYQSAAYSNNVVDEMGYGNFSNTDLQKFLSGKVVTVSPVVEEYNEYISAGSNVKDMETMFQLIYLKCTAPRKDETAFKSFVSREKQMVEQALQNPQYSFAENVYRDLYQKHPRAHAIPSPADFDSIDIDHAINFYKQRLGNMNGMHFYIVGNIKPEDIKPLLSKYIAAIPGGEINTAYKDFKMIPKPGVNTFTYKKGKEKQSLLSHYIFNDATYNADSAFYLNVLNEIINNKIIDTIREAMSAIYGGGIGGSLQKIPNEMYMLQSNFPCGPENVGKVDTAFWKIIESVKKPGGITEADLTKARKPLLEANKVRVKTNNYWTSIMQAADKNGYSAERVLTYEERLNAITPAMLEEIANRYYTKNNVYTAILLPE